MFQIYVDSKPDQALRKPNEALQPVVNQTVDSIRNVTEPKSNRPIGQLITDDTTNDVPKIEASKLNSSKIFAQGMKVDCPDKECTLEYRVLPTCVMYQPNPGSDCDIPCNLANCKVEVRHFFDCPVWSCTSFTTTSLPPTLSPLPHHGSSDGALYSSVAVNLFLVLVGGFLVHKIRKLRRNAHQPLSDVESGIIRNRPPSSSSVPSDLNHFSLDDSNEVQPLLSSRSQTQTLDQNLQQVESAPPNNESRSALMQRLQNFRWQNFRWSFAARDWVENQPESNARGPSIPSNNLVNPYFTASAPALSGTDE